MHTKNVNSIKQELATGEHTDCCKWTHHHGVTWTDDASVALQDGTGNNGLAQLQKRMQHDGATNPACYITMA